MPSDDFSGYDEFPSGTSSLGNDSDTVKAINKRSSTASKAIAGVLALAAAGTGVWAYQQSQASATRMEPFAQIDVANADTRNAALRDILANAEFEDVKERAILNLGHYRDAQAVPLLIQSLDDTPVVKRAAARALAAIGSPAADPAKPKLLELLPEVTDVERNQVVWTLAVLGAQEEPVMQALVERFSVGDLQELDGFDDRIVARALGISRLSSAALTDHEKESVRVLTAHALSETGGDAVVAPLAHMLTAELGRDPSAEEDAPNRQSAEVIRAAAAGLGRTGSPSGADALFQALTQAPGMKDTIVAALRQSTGAPQIASLLSRPSGADVRENIVDILVQSHDRRVVDPLAALLSDPNMDIRFKAATALADFGDERAVPALLQLAATPDAADIVNGALLGLTHVANASSVGALTTMLETHAHRKAVVMRALGHTGDGGASAVLERELEGEDVGAAARALAALRSDSGFRKVLAMVARPRNVDMSAYNPADRKIANEELLSSRRAAILAMGFFGREEGVRALQTVVEDGHDDYELRAAAAASIGQIGSPAIMREIAAKVAAPGLDEFTRRYYVQAIWQRPSAELVPVMLDLMANNAADAEVRRAAALAVGYAADPSADERLQTLLDVPETRRYAAIAVSLGAGEAATAKLLTVLAADGDLRDVLQGYYMGDESAWFDLVTPEMFTSGAMWRRLRTARQLFVGQGETSYSYVWTKCVGVLRSGWDGVGAIRPQAIRETLYEGLAGQDDARREVAAFALGDLAETALLLRARDEGGAAGEAARSVLLRGH